MTMIKYLKKKWLMLQPLFVCKEFRKQKEEQIAELARKDEYVKKHELFLTFKGLTIHAFTYNPKYLNGNERYAAYVEKGDRMLTAYSINKSKIEAKYDAIQKYYRKYGQSNV